MFNKMTRFFSWEDRVGRREYMLVGFSLATLKMGIDYAVLTMLFHLPWSWSKYFSSRLSQIFYEGRIEQHIIEFLVMSLLAAPFMYIGVVYTVKRCRDVGAPTWLAGFFFVPYLKFALIAALCALESRPGSAPPKEVRRRTTVGRFIPAGKV